jgi:hypothetical protein
VRDKAVKGDEIFVGTLRIFSVGVVNDGGTVNGVSVKVLRIEPPQLHECWTSALRVLDEPDGTSKRDVHNSSQLLAFYEVLGQVFGDGASTFLGVRFASP